MWAGLLGSSPDAAPQTRSQSRRDRILLHSRAPPSQGNPKAQASWTHNGQSLDSQRVNVRTGQQDSILFIRSAQRSDSGCYELTVRLGGLEAKAAINILVTGTCWRLPTGTQTPPPLPPTAELTSWGLAGEWGDV